MRTAATVPQPATKSTHPQLGTQLGTDSHGCSYSRACPVTSASRAAYPQVRPVRVRSVSPHTVDNPGGGAPCRPVDEAVVCAQHRPGHDKAPAPEGRGPRSVHRAPADHSAGRDHRQRIDMTRPATIAPNPIAKFQGPSETMNGIRSPAT